jgi:cell wall-associated NlpC family hydrolase
LTRPGPAAVAAGFPALALGLAGLLFGSLLPLPAAEAATSSGVGPAQAGLVRANQHVASDQAKAATISAQIQAAGLLLAKYAERADAETVRAGELDTRLRVTRSASTLANLDLANARRLLVTQAIAAYTEGGAFSYAPGTVRGSGLIVASAYAEVVAERQQMALSNYGRALVRDKALFSELSEQRASVRAATRQLSADRAAAATQQSSLRVTLAGVKGDLALAVAEVQTQQEAVQAAEEKALLESTGQLPGATPVMGAERAPSVRPAGTGGESNGLAPDGPGSVSSQDRTTTAPASTTTSAAEAEVPLAAAVTTSAAPTTTTSAPASTTTSAAPVTTSSPATTLPPSTTTTASVPSTTSTTAVSSLSTSSTDVTTIPSTTTTAAPSASGSSATTAPVNPTTTTDLATAGNAAGDSQATSAAGTSASTTASAPSTSVAPVTSTTLAPVTSTTLAPVTSTTAAPVTSTTATPGGSANYLPASGWQLALDFAESQIGKPYRWGGAGPATYDCSGLTMVAWAKAGVSMPHSAQYQYDMTARVPISQLQPGDLVFFGTPTDVYHVGMYVGGGNMVDAPETGQDVMIQPIYELNLLTGGRP